MMVVMTPEATQAQIDAIVERLQAGGVHAKVMPGELTTAIGAIGDPEGVREMGLEGLPGVDRVIPISRPYKLASSELSHHAPTVFDVNGHSIGSPSTFSLIAGPCTVESRDQTLTVARAHLDHVDGLLELIGQVRGGHLAHDRQARLLARLAQDSEGLGAEPLEGERRCPRLVGAAPEHRRAAGGHLLGDGERLISGFNRERARDEAEGLGRADETIEDGERGG